jgi:hypothetical protein
MIKKYIFLSAFFMLFFFSCSWLKEDENLDDSGNLFVAVSLENANSTTRGIRQTTYSKLFLRVLDDLGSVIKDTSITSSNDLVMCSLGKIPAQRECSVIAWTQDASGDIIHLPDTQSVVVEVNSTSNLALFLKPRVGSIFAQFVAVATYIDSFFMSFDSDSGSFASRVPRATNTFISLDKVPYGASGILSLQVTRKDKSLLVNWDTLFTFQKDNISLELSFVNSGAANFSITVDKPYNTTISGFGDTTVSLGAETNAGVLITEFCVNGTGDKDFVEIANLSAADVNFNELSIWIGLSSKAAITVKNVVIAPQKTFVFANTAADVWQNINAVGSLALVASYGMLRIYGDGILLDYVIYSDGGISGWPKLPSSGGCSWTLKENIADPKFNNHSSNWKVSTDTAFVDGTKNWYGSPGVL